MQHGVCGRRRITGGRHSKVNMRQKVIKALRKEMRKDIAAKYAGFKDYLREKSFWERFFILWGILWKP